VADVHPLLVEVSHDLDVTVLRCGSERWAATAIQTQTSLMQSDDDVQVASGRRGAQPLVELLQRVPTAGERQADTLDIADRREMEKR